MIASDRERIVRRVAERRRPLRPLEPDAQPIEAGDELGSRPRSLRRLLHRGRAVGHRDHGRRNRRRRRALLRARTRPSIQSDRRCRQQHGETHSNHGHSIPHSEYAPVDILSAAADFRS